MSLLLGRRPPRRTVLPVPTPRALWDAAGRRSRWRFWLDGGGTGPTYVAGGRPLWIFRGRGNRVELLRPGRPVRYFPLGDPAAILRGLLRDREPVPDGTFRGGAAGYWGYECARLFDPAGAARGAVPRSRAGAVPDFLWVLPAFWAVFDKDRFEVISQDGHRGSARFSGLRQEERSPARHPSFLPVPSAGNRRAYEAGVRRIQRYIAAGDIYQANLTHRLDLPWPRGADPADFFDRLRGLNPSPYAALMEFDGWSLATCSPELLLRVEGDRAVTRPIAGTRPRGATAAADRRLSGELLLHPKERAEHIMLVDLERNDLGRVCRPGSVRVSESLALERYSHVTHIVSQVEGRLRPGLDGLDALKAIFPGGTITGCPKRRCMEILQSLEKEPRGPFFGSAGWIGFNGDMAMNILIRTALIRGGKMSARVGAGIVADSDPAKEYEETLHKARALLAAYRMMGIQGAET